MTNAFSRRLSARASTVPPAPAAPPAAAASAAAPADADDADADAAADAGWAWGGSACIASVGAGGWLELGVRVS